MLVANFKDEGPYRCEPFEKGRLAANALAYLTDKYLNLLSSNKSLPPSFDYNFIRKAL